MANTINSAECIGCGNCEPECLNRAIHAADGEVYAIDPGKCDECTDREDESRCYSACPTDAVVMRKTLVAA